MTEDIFYLCIQVPSIKCLYMKLHLTSLRILFIAICTLSIISCKEEIMHRGRTPLVSVGEEFLYLEDVQRFSSTNPSIADSAQYVNEFINRWIEEALFYNVALRNVPSSREIEKLVDSYKRSLVLNIYQNGLIEQHLQQEITNGDVLAFYNSNNRMFEVEEPIMKGIFMRVKKGAPKISSIRKWYKSRAIEDLEKLDKYSLADDTQYEYFAETWKRVSDIAARTPITENDLLQRLLRNAAIELNDKEYVYFISADTIIGKDGLKPLELVEDEIRNLLVNTKKVSFIKEKKRALFDEAIEKGSVKYYNE